MKTTFICDRHTSKISENMLPRMLPHFKYIHMYVSYHKNESKPTPCYAKLKLKPFDTQKSTYKEVGVATEDSAN